MKIIIGSIVFFISIIFFLLLKLIEINKKHNKNIKEINTSKQIIFHFKQDNSNPELSDMIKYYNKEGEI